MTSVSLHPKISVIIPCYNAAKYLAQALESVCNQTFSNIEIILVNDGSTDDTEKVIQSFHDKRIKYFSQANKGQCAAANKGLAESTGDYVKFFDADDIMNPEHLQAQLNSLDGSLDKVSACNWGRFQLDEDYRQARFDHWDHWSEMDPLTWIKKEIDQRDYMLGDMMAGWLWLIPRAVIEKAGGWDDRLSLNNDFEFSIRLLLQCSGVVFAQDARMYYRSGNSSSLNAVKSEKNYEEAFLSTHLGCSYLLARDNSDAMRRLCANRYQLWVTRIYPDYPALVHKFEAAVVQLGGADLQMQSGRLFNYLVKTTGWKKAVLIKLGIEKLLKFRRRLFAISL